ncbi:RDD family protein [Evansella sp. AB-rgal1]|uniref:RDD family protein n=1 Tax=Evansella sp. AB-rgal1 TaxID=3242696 RepID=UPI00359D82FA
MNVLRDSPVGLFQRGFALFIDLIIIIIFALTLHLVFQNESVSFESSLILRLAASFPYIYAVFLPLFWNGYTIGKRLVGIRIARVSGEKLTLGTMIIRELLANLLYYVTFGILSLISVYLVSTRDDKRSIHDLLAGTYVTSNLPEQE